VLVTLQNVLEEHGHVTALEQEAMREVQERSKRKLAAQYNGFYALENLISLTNLYF